MKKQDFNKEWLFSRDTGDAKGPGFDDSKWQKLKLPHDWAIAGPFSDENNCRTGALPIKGTGWYRKHFTVDKKDSGKIISIEFDGAMSNAHVWVNGEFAGQRPYGYIGFEFDITELLKFGEENVIAVRLNQEDLSQRWYPGAGIYRNVHIKYKNKVHIPQWGTFITTPEISDSKALVNIETKVKNHNSSETEFKLATIIKDSEGEIVCSFGQELNIAAGTLLKVDQQLTIDSPHCWDTNAPYLYKAVSQVLLDGKIVDEYTTEFGVRIIEFTANDGFNLNGRRVQFHGVCLHHDQGPLGTAFNYRAKERQMEIMLSMGVNALRTSHNPPAPEMLQICDRMGILVIVEAFDEWKIGKVKNGYHKYFDEWHERDLRDMIRRDRNHPSVILWSIGNEILEQKEKDGWKVAKILNDIAHHEDPTRLTTAGFNQGPSTFKNKIALQVDVVGFNYWPSKYEKIKKQFPEVILYGSETASMTSSRGIYHLPIEPEHRHETGQVSSYDTILGPGWAYPPDVEFMYHEKNPSVLGEFIWTGMDYLGEPTPYCGRDNHTMGYWNNDWPSHSSYFAPVDLIGLPKDRFYLYQSQWSTEPMVHLLPHWNWGGMEGEEIPVFAYTNAEEVELFVNGKSFGKRVKGVDKTMIPAQYWGHEGDVIDSKYRLSWNVPYQPGSIKAVASSQGRVVAEKEIRTAGEARRINLEADRKAIKADGRDLSYITVTIVDSENNLCPNAENLVSVDVKGAGFHAGVGNGNPRSLRTFKGNSMEAFSGKLMLILQTKETSGEIKVSANSEGLSSSYINIEVE